MIFGIQINSITATDREGDATALVVDYSNLAKVDTRRGRL